VRVAEAVGAGKVKVSLSFPDWKEGNVAPATFEVPVVEPEAKGEAKRN